MIRQRDRRRQEVDAGLTGGLWGGPARQTQRVGARLQHWGAGTSCERGGRRSTSGGGRRRRRQRQTADHGCRAPCAAIPDAVTHLCNRGRQQGRNRLTEEACNCLAQPSFGCRSPPMPHARRAHLLRPKRRAAPQPRASRRTRALLPGGTTAWWLRLCATACQSACQRPACLRDAICAAAIGPHARAPALVPPLALVARPALAPQAVRRPRLILLELQACRAAASQPLLQWQWDCHRAGGDGAARLAAAPASPPAARRSPPGQPPSCSSPDASPDPWTPPSCPSNNGHMLGCVDLTPGLAT